MGGAGGTVFLTSFIGRQAELARLLEMARTSRLLTLVGPGGTGKSRLAYRALDELAGSLPDRVWPVELADVSDAGVLGATIAAGVGATVGSDAVAADAIVACVRDDPAWIYLDNCEHLTEACADLAVTLLRRCRGLRIMTSSRQLLGVPGEQACDVPALTADDALELFTDRARLALPDWAPSESELRCIADLCATLDRIPLSIELAAPQIRTFTPEAIAKRLLDQFDALGSVRGEHSRRTSLEACIQWSHDLCTPQERVLWLRLSVFAGRFALEAVQQACCGPELPAESALAVLAGLVDKSVINRDATDPECRYRMLEGIRQFGVAQLTRDGGLDEARRRHRRYYSGLVERFEREWLGPNQAAWMTDLEHERANLRLALDDAVASAREAPTAMRMSPVIEHFFASTGGIQEGIQWLATALAFDAGSPHERAAALRVGVFIASIGADLDTAERMVAELRTLAQGSRDARVRALLLYADAVRSTFAGAADTGAAIAADGVALLHELGETWLEANLQFLRGMTLGWADRPDEAALAYRACFDLTEPRGERWLTSYSQWGMGLDALLAGQVQRAIDLERTALRAKAEFGDQLGIGLTIEVLAWAAAERGDGHEAAILLGAALAIWNTIGMSVAAMPYISRRREAGVAAAKRLLTPSDYDDHIRWGGTMPQQLAIAVALGERKIPERHSSLSRREQEIADLLRQGASNRRIAEQLVISVRTAESHVESILRKLGVRSRSEVAAALLQQDR